MKIIEPQESRIKRIISLTSASSRVVKGMEYSAEPGTLSTLASAPKAKTNLSAQLRKDTDEKSERA